MKYEEYQEDNSPRYWMAWRKVCAVKNINKGTKLATAPRILRRGRARAAGEEPTCRRRRRSRSGEINQARRCRLTTSCSCRPLRVSASFLPHSNLASLVAKLILATVLFLQASFPFHSLPGKFLMLRSYVNQETLNNVVFHSPYSYCLCYSLMFVFFLFIMCVLFTVPLQCVHPFPLPCLSAFVGHVPFTLSSF